MWQYDHEENDDTGIDREIHNGFKGMKDLYCINLLENLE